MPIYCDESGYTGYNLLVEQQPYFVYSALNIEEQEATQYAKYLKDKYYLQGELKGANLTGSKNGKAAIRELFEKYINNVKIVYHHKKYALSCKYFEYAFEPALSSYNKLFYQRNFHRFIANLVFITFENKTATAEDLFLSFQNLLRGNDFEGLFTLLQNKDVENDLTTFVAQFTIQQRERILQEITTDGKSDYWILDLTTTALYNLLCLWGDELDNELTVVCDSSQPLKEAVNRMAIFTDLHQPKKTWNPLGRGETPLNFSLEVPIVFSPSKKCAGLQLADIFASSMYYALVNPDSDISLFVEQYREEIVKNSGSYCIMPEPSLYLMPGTIDFDFGLVALSRLAEFSLKSPENAAQMFVEHMRNGINAYLKNNP